jgi:hypothetical protein
VSRNTDKQAQQLGNLLTWHMTCTPRCRGFVHEDHVFVDADSPGDQEQIRGGVAIALADECGVDVLDVALDQDARPPETFDHIQGTIIEMQAVAPGVSLGVIDSSARVDDLNAIRMGVPGETIGYLARFLSPWPLNAIRKDLCARNAYYRDKLTIAGDHVA